ncbi:MAG: alanine racemase [Calditrichaceae bacterium]|nr:alanine racemase [Calditrichaceae bacterium]
MKSVYSPNLQVFNESQLKKLHKIIDTPALLIIEDRLDRNILQMQTLADENYSWLRPHIKTHKSADIAHRQIILGASGITTAKLSEAEIMYEAGVDDIFIANQITHPLKINRLIILHSQCRVIIGIDNEQQIELLRPAFQKTIKPLEVRIEIDSGFSRCGIKDNKALLNLAQKIMAEPWLLLEGIFTHAGQVYSASTETEVAKIGEAEAKAVELAHTFLHKKGIEVQTVSVGSTPTAKYSVRNDAVNEIRPGNYVFYDGIQLTLGSARAESCSLFVLATVISQPQKDQIVIDAGSKALGLDRGAHSMQLLTGYGTPVNIRATIERLSEEHGILKLDQAQIVELGSPVIILPNHACSVANLFEKYYLINEHLEMEMINISARKKSQ